MAIESADTWNAGNGVVSSLPGDSNRDGLFNLDDIVQVLIANKFNTGSAATWEQGDWNYDGVFDVHDIVLALTQDNFNAGVAATEAVDQYHLEQLDD